MDADIRARIDRLTVRDAHRLRKRARRPIDAEALLREVEVAEARVAARLASVPALRYPPSLPISARGDDLVAAIQQHQVVVVAGETGSGKSTQLPKLCLQAGRGVLGMIGHTQPRRLAARAIAERVAEEVGSEVGGTVGFAVRFTDRVGDSTLVKVMTDGILLAELQRDRLLTAYDTIIVDEAHERSLNIDFILGYLRQLLPKRPDLRVVITSATLDTERFSQHFGGAPVVEVSGRSYPVEVRYRPFDHGDQVQAVVDAVDELAGEGPGDVLVFLSGEREIRDTADAISKLERPGLDVLPLYARLSAAEQHRVFEPHTGRRVVLATNVAETSLTVPGIRYVVDPGTARISRYNRRTKVQRLPIEPVSQASANQRAGRCGRVAPGICIRLYDEDDYESRPEFTEPEILRTNLASVILQMTAIGLGDVARFPFVDAPDARNINDGMALLAELGALDGGKLTGLGRDLARLPLDPRLGRMVVEANTRHCLREVKIIAAALAIQDPRERPADKQEAAREMHARFVSPGSDFLALLNLWNYLREKQRELSSNQFRRLCRNEHLNYLRVREWQDVHAQLGDITRGLGMRANSDDAPADAVHVSLLSGLLSHIGMRDGERREYRGARDARFALSPGSSLFSSQPKWVMAAELVETTRLWAHVAARIQPEWAEDLGSHLVKRAYSEPRWDAKRAAAVALERVTLYGLPIVVDRRVDYAPIDPTHARELFVDHALVGGEWTTHHRFVAENARLIDAVRRLEDRVRRRDILVGDEVLFEFFAERVPDDVTSGRRFDRWWKDARRSTPDLMSFTFDLLVAPGVGRVRLEDYPDEWRQGDLALPLSYEFDLESPTDGVTVRIPLAVLNQVDPGGFDWHIPGRRRELVAALVRSLPKDLRRHFIPVAEHVDGFLASCSPADGPMLTALARYLSRTAGVEVLPGDWDVDQLPGDLRITFRVEDERGRAVTTGNDLGELKWRLRERVGEAIAAAAAAGVERSGLTSWTIGELPRLVETARNGNAVKGYPALVDEGDSVAVRVLPSPAEQFAALWSGLRRLLLLTVGSPKKSVLRVLTNPQKLALGAGPSSAAEVLDDCVVAAVDALMERSGAPVWDADSFERLRAVVSAELVALLLEVVPVVGDVLRVSAAVREELRSLTSPALRDAAADVRTQLDNLVFPGFVSGWGAPRMVDVLRFVRGAERRVERMRADPARDRVMMARVKAVETRFDEVLSRWRVDDLPPDAARIHFMIEELRVSFFAQQLGTSGKVSEKRILEAIESLAGGGSARP